MPEEKKKGTHWDEEGMARRLQEYKDRNDESQGNPPVVSFFEKRGVQALVVKGEDAEKDQQKAIETYLEKEGKLSETLAEGKVEVEEIPKEEEQEDKKANAEAEVKSGVEGSTTEKPMDKAKEQERELLESRSQHMRKYLMDKVIPVLAEGVLKVCKEQPNDPVEFLVKTL